MNPTELRIEFEQLSQAEIVENNGPDFILIPEYVPMVLIESILKLVKLGFEISIGQFHQ